MRCFALWERWELPKFFPGIRNIILPLSITKKAYHRNVITVSTTVIPQISSRYTPIFSIFFVDEHQMSRKLNTLIHIYPLFSKKFCNKQSKNTTRQYDFNRYCQISLRVFPPHLDITSLLCIRLSKTILINHFLVHLLPYQVQPFF